MNKKVLIWFQMVKSSEGPVDMVEAKLAISKPKKYQSTPINYVTILDTFVLVR